MCPLFSPIMLFLSIRSEDFLCQALTKFTLCLLLHFLYFADNLRLVPNVKKKKKKSGMLSPSVLPFKDARNVAMAIPTLADLARKHEPA